MPVGGGPAAQKITPGKVSHAPTSDKPSHVSTQHTVVHVPLATSVKGAHASSSASPPSEVSHASTSVVYGSSSVPTIDAASDADHLTLQDIRMWNKVFDPSPDNYHYTGGVEWDVLLKVKKFSWGKEAREAGKGLNSQDTQRLADILAKSPWVKNPGGAAHHNTVGVGIPNADQLTAAQTHALTLVHGNPKLRKAVNAFYNEVGNSDRYQDANFLTGTMNEQAAWEGNYRWQKYLREKKEGEHPAQINPAWGV